MKCPECKSGNLIPRYLRARAKEADAYECFICGEVFTKKQQEKINDLEMTILEIKQKLSEYIALVTKTVLEVKKDFSHFSYKKKEPIVGIPLDEKTKVGKVILD